MNFLFTPLLLSICIVGCADEGSSFTKSSMVKPIPKTSIITELPDSSSQMQLSTEKPPNELLEFLRPVLTSCEASNPNLLTIKLGNKAAQGVGVFNSAPCAGEFQFRFLELSNGKMLERFRSKAISFSHFDESNGRSGSIMVSSNPVKSIAIEPRGNSFRILR